MRIEIAPKLTDAQKSARYRARQMALDPVGFRARQAKSLAKCRGSAPIAAMRVPVVPKVKAAAKPLPAPHDDAIRKWHRQRETMPVNAVQIVKGRLIHNFVPRAEFYPTPEVRGSRLMGGEAPISRNGYAARRLA